MKTLITQLEFIYAYAKHIHYNYEGANFLSVHEYMDDVTDGIHEKFVDGIKEKYFMCKGLPVPSFEETYGDVIDKIREVSDFTIEGLCEQIKVLIYATDQVLRDDKTLNAGDTDLLGKIASRFQTNLALLSRTRQTNE